MNGALIDLACNSQIKNNLNILNNNKKNQKELNFKGSRDHTVLSSCDTLQKNLFNFKPKRDDNGENYIR